MTKQDVIRKLTSRKLWLSIASFVSMLLMATGHAESEAAQIAALVMAGASVVGYVLAEGLADAGHADDGLGVVDAGDVFAVGFQHDAEDEEGDE